MLREQTIVMDAELGALDDGTVARTTVPQDRRAASNRLHE